MEPDAPALHNADGSINWAPDASGKSTFWNNPMLSVYNKYQNKTANLLSSLTLNYKVLPGMGISSRFGYNSIQTNDFIPFPLIAVMPERRGITQRSAGYGNRDINSWNIEPQITYSKTIYESKIDLLAGSTLLHLNTNSGYLYGTGYLSDDMLGDIHAANTIISAQSSTTQYKYNSVFSRVNYSLRDKYIFNLTTRRDGSSRFGGANRFHNFYSIGGAWLFLNEGFLQKKLTFLNFGKIRASYGTTGSDQIGDYKFLSLYTPFAGVGVPYQGAGSIIPAGLPNPYLQWEETKKMQVGIDLGFLQDKIVINASYVRNRSSNQLLSYILPSQTGFSGYLSNFPAIIQNRSWEFLINTINIKQKNFAWTSSFNLTIPRNELVAFPNLSSSTYSNTFVIGQPVSITRSLRYSGVDPTTGNYLFSSKTDPFNPKFPDDYSQVINKDQKFYGGLQNTFSYKGLELDFLFQFVKQLGFNDALFWNGNRYPGNFYRGLSNQTVMVLDRWQKPGDVTSIKKFTTNPDNYILASDYRYSDASYIRLKNVSISWAFPEKWISKAHLKKGNAYLHGQNLLTITNYKGLDPESQNILTPSLPPLRIITAGVQLGL
jgi:hypothetical protein